MTPVQLLTKLEALRDTLRRLGYLDVVSMAMMVAAIVGVFGAVLRVVTGIPRYPVVGGAALAAAVVAGAARWRATRPDRVGRIDAALWAEAQAPQLQYALVTLAEQPRADDGDHAQRRLASQADAAPWSRAVEAAVGQRRLVILRRGLLALGGLVAALYPWQPRAMAAGETKSSVARAVAAVTQPGRVQASATVVPPAYTGRNARSIAFGETVTALVGSVVRVEGAGPLDDASLMIRESSDSGAGVARTVTRLAESGGWRGVVKVGTSPLALQLRDAAGERWVYVTPVVDSIPAATLTLPEADTLVFDSTAKIRVAGTVHDDLALRDARIEYIISSGGGEQFTFRSGVLQERRGGLGRDAALSASLDLGALGLKSGDLMHVRITAHDGNLLSGPSMGSSETRTIRIPRADERDSVAIEQLPPTPVDKSVLSQRMLLLQTERLVARIPRITRETMVAEAQRIGVDQARLRKQVADIVFARLGDTPSGEHAHFPGDGHNHSAEELAAAPTPEAVLKAAERATGGVSGMLDEHGDETPVVAVNRPLLEAYNAMWDATRALQGGVPRDAIEPMRRAVAAIQRARSAERIYLRGTPPAAVVDLAKVRLIGTDSARAEARKALAALPAPERLLAERVLRAMTLVTARDAAAIDSLRLIRLDALGAAPALATALQDLVSAVDAGKDATAALLRTRRVALLPWQSRAGPSLWLGATP